MGNAIRYSFYMDALREQFGGQCIDKGKFPDSKKYKKCRGRLEFSHIKPTKLRGRSRGRADRYHDIKNNPECYVLRCRRHHRLFDLKVYATGEELS